MCSTIIENVPKYLRKMHFGHILKVKYSIIYFNCNLYRVYGAIYNCNVFFTVAQYEYINIWTYNVFFKNSTWIELHGVQTNLVTRDILLHSGWFKVLRCNIHTQILFFDWELVSYILVLLLAVFSSSCTWEFWTKNFASVMFWTKIVNK